MAAAITVSPRRISSADGDINLSSLLATSSGERGELGWEGGKLQAADRSHETRRGQAAKTGVTP